MVCFYANSGNSSSLLTIEVQGRSRMRALPARLIFTQAIRRANTPLRTINALLRSATTGWTRLDGASGENRLFYRADGPTRSKDFKSAPNKSLFCRGRIPSPLRARRVFSYDNSAGGGSMTLRHRFAQLRLFWQCGQGDPGNIQGISAFSPSPSQHHKRAQKERAMLACKGVLLYCAVLGFALDTP